MKKGIMSISGVLEVNVNNDTDTIEITHEDTADLQIIKNKLHSMGYPERGTVEGLDKFVTNAKSYVSCAIGKLTKEEEEDQVKK
ncbi:MAG: heavy metal transporter [Sphingobacteriaceae bacterium]|nr:heavy metal transporter [Sphingobacteriaceae bacterium]